MNKKLITGVISVACCCAAVFAQQSIPNKASAGNTYTDVDDYMSVTDFQGTSFEKDMFYTNIITTGIEAGYGGKYNDWIFGAFVSGQFWNLTGSSQTEKTYSDNDVDDSVTRTAPGKTEAAFLFGTKDFGVKLSEKFNIKTTKTDTVSGDDYTHGKTDQSSYTTLADIGGFSFKAGDYKFRPFATVGFDLTKNTEKSEVFNYTDENNNDLTTVNSENNKSNIIVGVGSKFNFPTHGKYISGATAKYTQKIGLSKGLNGASEVVDKTAGTKTTATTTYVTEGTKSAEEAIGLTYWFCVPANEKITFGGAVVCPLTFSQNNPGLTTQLSSDGTVKYSVNGGAASATGYTTVSTNAVNFGSALYLGMEYKIKDTCRMYAGLNIDAIDIAFTEKTSEKYEVNAGTATKTKTTVDKDLDIYDFSYNNGANINNTLNFGFDFTLAESFDLGVAMVLPANPAILTDVLNGSLTIGVKYSK